MTEHIQFPDSEGARPTEGTAGLKTQLPGMAATVSAVACATEGIGAGRLIEAATG